MLRTIGDFWSDRDRLDDRQAGQPGERPPLPTRDTVPVRHKRREPSMTNRTIDNGIGRRDFARRTVGTLGAAALAGRQAEGAPRSAPGIKLCVQSPATP